MTPADNLPVAAAPDATQSQRMQRLVEADVRELRPQDVLCIGTALDSNCDALAARFRLSSARHVAQLDGRIPADQRADLVLCAGLLEQTPVAELDSLLRRLCSISEHVVFQISTCARPLAGEAPNCTVRYADWWRPKLRRFFNCVETVAVSPEDVVFKTWKSGALRKPLRAWRRALAQAELRSDASGQRREPAPLSSTPNCLACESAGTDYAGEKNGYHVWKCKACRLVFVNPMPTAAELNAFYRQHPRNDKYLRKADAKYRKARWRMMLLKHRVPGRRFLDIGCSVGSAVAAARDSGLDATGVDLDPQSIGFASERYPNCRFLETSATDLARAGERFDLIFCTEVIEHVIDPQSFVDDLRTLLHPGGIVFLTTPHATHVRVPRNILGWDSLKPPEHVVLFGRKSMTALFARRGFRILSAPLRWKTCLKVVVRRVA
ncbi:MAG: methyltransferase domain-containing protein [Planctomycetaceae bacterium]